MGAHQIDLGPFREMNGRTSKVAWDKRLEVVREHFPSFDHLDWNRVFRDDPGLMGAIVNDIIKASEATPKRPGKRSSVESEKARDHLAKLTGDDYSVEPFVPTFAVLRGRRSIRGVAGKTGLDRNMVHRLATGKIEPDMYVMEVLAKAFGKTADYFLEYRVNYIVMVLITQLTGYPESSIHHYRKLRKIGKYA